MIQFKGSKKMTNYKIYNPDQTPDGLEARYKIENKTLYLEIDGANSFWDWMKCIFGSLFRTEEYNRKHYQKLWFNMADAFVFYFILCEEDFNHVVGVGHSMGGVLLDIVLEFFKDNNCIVSGTTYGSPKSNREGHTNIINYYNKGDIVPFLPPWFKKVPREMLCNKWRLPWKAHSAYDWRLK